MNSDESTPDNEANRFAGRARRYASVGARVGGVAARMAGARLTGRDAFSSANADLLTAALGGLKGPLMKVAQFMATIPEALPEGLAEKLQTLQSNAPPMGAAFVTRRMRAELGPDWRARFRDFDLHPAHAASLGQVHRATSLEGEALACKLQYPDMKSVVEADLKQLEVIFALRRRFDGAVDTREMAQEISDRVREELDYTREAKHTELYRFILCGKDSATNVRVPQVHRELSTGRLLTLGWLEGEKLLDFKSAPQEERNAIARAMFRAWWHPFIGLAIIHGDPHLGNYTVFREGGAPAGINLLDYGCVRIFNPHFVRGVVDLYQGLLQDDRARIVHAYETWGFRNLKSELIDVLNIWARFIYGPLLDDRERHIAEGVSPGQYGREQAMLVHRELKAKGPVTIPREFVFMDRAAIGLGGAFLHLDAKLNFYRMFNEAMHADSSGGFDVEGVAHRQSRALAAAGL
ncbi:MAG: AarF/ABC1/UbiB kinase family protein [Alphaproteobacteria bacterium]|nr:AarF/ABC1/UbiB kinase family protein [Alphaproteobacteria bacterium]